MDTLKSVGESFKSGKGFFSFNGTLAGLGAPIIRPIAYKKVNCKFYNLKYLKSQGITENQINNLIKATDQDKKFASLILQRDFKESFERTYYLRDDGFLNGFWFPIGLANNLTQYADAAKAALFNKLFIKDNIVSDIVMLVNDFLVLKPIIVRNESLKVSSFVQKKKERLNSFEETKEYTNKDEKTIRQTQKFYEYNDVEGKEYSFNLDLFTVMNNLWSYLLQYYLKKWTQTASKDGMEINRKESQVNNSTKQSSVIKNFSHSKFLQERAFPTVDNCIFKTDNYLIFSYQNVFASKSKKDEEENDSITYLFDYYNDSFMLTNLKLTSYDITKNTNGDALSISLQFDKTIACERVFNYDTLRTTNSGGGSGKTKATGSENESKEFEKGQVCRRKDGSINTGDGNSSKICYFKGQIKGGIQ